MSAEQAQWQFWYHYRKV